MRLMQGPHGQGNASLGCGLALVSCRDRALPGTQLGTHQMDDGAFVRHLPG